VVVSFSADYVILRTGGWNTVTTKARMNQASNQFNLGYCVNQTNFIWYVSTWERNAQTGVIMSKTSAPFKGSKIIIDRKTGEILFNGDSFREEEYYTILSRIGYLKQD
jgi:hypothetical protein